MANYMKQNSNNFIPRILVLTSLFLVFFACKTNQTNANSDENLKTYAEISIAQGGEWGDGTREHKEYKGGTSFKNISSFQVPIEHTDHSWYIRYEGPGWENNQIGYRLYLDWRNAIDIYGKKVDSLVLPYVGQDGFDSYHEPASWGQDILKAGKSMGIGGYGRFMNDTIAHFHNVKNTVVKIENTKSSSSVNISYEEWKTGNETINLNSKLTINPEDRFTKAVLTFNKEISGICTGIVKFKEVPLIKKAGNNWAYIATYGVQTLATPPDNLGMALFYKLDEVTEQKMGAYEHLVIFKPSVKTMTYYFLGAWEQEKNGIKSQDEFLKDINSKLETLEKTNTL